MIGKALIALNRMMAIPAEQPECSAALREDNYRGNTWAARNEYQLARNEERRAEFDALLPLFRIPGVPHWMGPPAAPRVKAASCITADSFANAMTEIAALVDKASGSSASVHKLSPAKRRAGA